MGSGRGLRLFLRLIGHVRSLLGCYWAAAGGGCPRSIGPTGSAARHGWTGVGRGLEDWLGIGLERWWTLGEPAAGVAGAGDLPVRDGR
jgi:hypothetical protein